MPVIMIISGTREEKPIDGMMDTNFWQTLSQTLKNIFW